MRGDLQPPSGILEFCFSMMDIDIPLNNGLTSFEEQDDNLSSLSVITQIAGIKAVKTTMKL